MYILKWTCPGSWHSPLLETMNELKSTSPPHRLKNVLAWYCQYKSQITTLNIYRNEWCIYVFRLGPDKPQARLRSRQTPTGGPLLLVNTADFTNRALLIMGLPFQESPTSQLHLWACCYLSWTLENLSLPRGYLARRARTQVSKRYCYVITREAHTGSSTVNFSKQAPPSWATVLGDTFA